MKNKIKSFSESIKNEEDFLESTYNVGALKEFIKDLPDDMSVICMDDNNKVYWHWVKVMNSSKLGLTNPITGGHFDTLLINFEEE